MGANVQVPQADYARHYAEHWYFMLSRTFTGDFFKFLLPYIIIYTTKTIMVILCKNIVVASCLLVNL